VSPRRAAAPATEEPDGFRVQPTGQPRLLAPDTPPVAGGPPTDDQRAAGVPPGAGPAGDGLAPPPASWQPDEAAAAVVGSHNVVGAAVLMRDVELLEAWRAEAAELRAAGPALARLLDRVAPPGAGGPVGLGLDLMSGLGAIVGMELRHGRAVADVQRRRAREKATRQVFNTDGTPAQPAQDARPRRRASTEPSRNGAAAPGAAEGGGYHYPPEWVAVLGVHESAAGQPTIEE
jgi:hypothetical protein